MKGFHIVVNDVVPSIRFTYEVKRETVLPFPDTSICRCNMKHTTTHVCLESSDTGTFLCFKLHYQVEHKLAVVKTRFSRYDRLVPHLAIRAANDAGVTQLLINENTPYAS